MDDVVQEVVRSLPEKGSAQEEMNMLMEKLR